MSMNENMNEDHHSTDANRPDVNRPDVNRPDGSPRRRPRRAVRRRASVDYDREAESRPSPLTHLAADTRRDRRPGDDRMMIIDDDPATIDEPGDNDAFLREQRPPHYGGD